jgi:hypothetical protein
MLQLSDRARPCRPLLAFIAVVVIQATGNHPSDYAAAKTITG